MSKHEKFILTPMSIVLEEVILASSGIGLGIETYPLCDYIMQSLLLKITGFQEQKMKCIIWEIATNDFDVRRKLLINEFKLGECSSYKSKNTIYKQICEQIKGFDSGIECNDLDRGVILEKSCDLIERRFNNTNLAIWQQKAFNEFIKKCSQFLNNKNNKNINLLESSLQADYEILYKQRNRIAHNTLSYQQNLPDFRELRKEKDNQRNYFVWFSILLYIDNIFIELYKKYLKGLEEQIL